MFERFTEKALKSIMHAQEEARRTGHDFVGTEAILLGLIAEGRGLAAKVLKSAGGDLATTRIEVEKIKGCGSGGAVAEIPFTPRSKRVLELTWENARQLGHPYIGTEHLLLGLIDESDESSVAEKSQGVAAKVLRNMEIDLSGLRLKVLDLIETKTVEHKFEPNVWTESSGEDELGGNSQIEAKTPSDSGGSKKRVRIERPLTVKELARRMQISEVTIIKHLFFERSAPRTVNEIIELDLARQTALALGYELI